MRSVFLMRFAANLIVCGLLGLTIVWACRWIRKRDSFIGSVVQLGVVLRAWSGLLLFLISYLRLPILQSLYLGDGFWDLAPDARGYYSGAMIAAEEGLRTVPDWSASPAFVKVLGLWMRAVGISPASAVLLNVAGYLGVAVILVAVFQTGRSKAARTGLSISVLAFTFSPAFLLFGTQALKDQFFALLLAASCAAAWVGFRALGPLPLWNKVYLAAVGSTVTAITTYLMAGIRPYVAFLVVMIIAAVLAAFAWRKPRRQVAIHALVSALIVAFLWWSFKAGGGAYYGYYEAKVLAVVGISRNPSDAPLGAILSAREGFVRSGGATNIVRRVAHREGAGLIRLAWEYTCQLALGTLVLLLPISFLKWMSIVDFAGGRGLLVVTDLDTIFIDVTLLAVVLLLKRTWSRQRPNLAFTVFTAALCGLLAALMAFVVTNYGSLFRLRLMVAALIWLLPLALARSDEVTAPSEQGAAQPVVASTG